MDILFDIGFDTVVYVLAGLVVVPSIIWKPQSIIYLLISISLFPSLFIFEIQIGTINIRTPDLIIALYCLIAGLIIVQRFINKIKPFNLPDSARTVNAFVLAYIVMHLAFVLVGLVQGVAVDSAIRRFLENSGFLYFYFPVLFLRDKQQLKKVLIFTVIIVMLYPIYQFVKFATLPEHSRLITSSGTIRISSSGLPVVACGLFIVLCWNDKIKYYILTAFPLMSILFAGHRSGFLALGVSLILLFVIQKKLSKALLFAYLTGLSLFLVLVGVEVFTGHSFYDDALKRSSDTFSSENPTTVARIIAINDNIYIFKRRPIAGIGYNHEILTKLFPYSELERERAPGTGDMGAVFNVLHPHNFILRVMSNSGLIGTLLVLVIIYLVMKRCYGFVRYNGTLLYPGVFLLSSIVFFLVFALMNTTFFSVSEGYIFWILCGMTVLVKDKIGKDGNLFVKASK